MKHIFTLSALILSCSLSAQTSKPKEPAKAETCLEGYQKAFAERGAFPVEDATYKNVIISVVDQKNGTTECFSGKVKVESTYVTAMYLMYEDNTYEFIDKKWRNENKAKINNGISDPLITDTGEKYYVIFTANIKPKKKQPKKVTGPDKNF